MGLFYLVEEYHAVGLAPYGFGQLATFVVTHISRRGSDESTHGMLLLILTHVDTRHHALIVEQVVSQSLRQLCLAHTSGAEEDKRGDRTLGVLQSGTAAAYGIGNGCDGFVLTHHAFVQFFFQMEQFLFLALKHTRNGDAGPAAHHLGDIVGGHLLAYHGIGSLGIV